MYWMELHIFKSGNYEASDYAKNATTVSSEASSFIETLDSFDDKNNPHLAKVDAVPVSGGVIKALLAGNNLQASSAGTTRLVGVFKPSTWSIQSGLKTFDIKFTVKDTVVLLSLALHPNLVAAVALKYVGLGLVLRSSVWLRLLIRQCCCLGIAGSRFSSSWKYDLKRGRLFASPTFYWSLGHFWYLYFSTYQCLFLGCCWWGIISLPMILAISWSS